MKKNYLKKIVLIGACIIAVPITFMFVPILIADRNISLLELVVQRFWTLSNILSLLLYIAIAFYFVPIWVNKKIAQLGPQANHTKIDQSKIFKLQISVFIGLIVFDLVVVQLPYYLMR